jgi:hypothetical protein
MAKTKPTQNNAGRNKNEMPAPQINVSAHVQIDEHAAPDLS